MHLTPREHEKLLVFVAAELARKRKARGLKLNYPEAIALITAEILEAARDGSSVSDVMVFGTTILTSDEVMNGVPEMLHEVQVECTFPDGTKLVTVHDPIRKSGVEPGEYLLKSGEIACNTNRRTVRVLVANTGDRPIQVGSHYHFAEVNSALRFDRSSAVAMRLNIASGTAVRFEPGEEKEVELVEYGGARHISGFAGLVNGSPDNETVAKIQAFVEKTQ